MKCRHCDTELLHEFIDLGSSPPSNAYLTEATIKQPEKWYPLRVLVCSECWLVQTEDYTGAGELFDADYAYFSSFSDSWLKHCEQYVDVMVDRLGLSKSSHVVEVAANDGYLLQYFKTRQIPNLGVEPTASTAQAAREKGIEIEESFFGVSLAQRLAKNGKQADLTVANNVLAHVPDINDFVAGFSYLLKPNGVATFEFPHLLQLIEHAQFDTIYHEHFSYLSLTAVQRIFTQNGLEVFDVQEIPTHGGSLRVFAQRADRGGQAVSDKVTEVLTREESKGLRTLEYYQGFQKRANNIKHGLLSFLLKAINDGKQVVAYGAAAKGNTLLNYSGIRPDLLGTVIDRNPAKQGKYLPGSKIPIMEEQLIKSTQPDYVLILPWNLKNEVMNQLSYIREWGGKFVVAVPSLETL
jgi:SAM-dependent methyltransferase